MKITIEKSPNQETRIYVFITWFNDFLTVIFVNRVKKSNVPTDEVTANLKTENGTDFRETNGKHAENHENHENGTGNTTEDKSEVDAEESIDLTDKVRKNCTYDYGFLFYFITDKMRRNEIIK